MRIGFVWIPRITIQVAILHDPSLRHRPLVVGGSAEPFGLVVDAGDEARAAGVQPGMRLRAALELVPAAAVRIADLDGTADVAERVLSLLERFSEVIEPIGIGGAYLRPVTAGPGLADQRRFGATVGDSLAAALGLVARIAIAPGTFVAENAAQHNAAAPVTIVPDVQATAFLAPRPVGELGLTPQAIERLTRLGITTISAFAALPPDSLPRRFGPEAIRAWHRAHGEDDTDLVPRLRPEVRTMRTTFEPTLADREILSRSARAILRRLCLALQAERRAFRLLRVIVVLENERWAEQRSNLRVPTNDHGRSQPVLDGLIESLRLDQAVALIEVRLEGIGPEPAVQGDLFAEIATDRRERVTRALAEVTRRYRGHLWRVTDGEDPRSLFDERRLLLLPFVPEGSVDRPRSPEPEARLRPVRVTLRAGSVFLREPAGSEEIVALHVRWEADEWWPRPVRRTYYRVRTRTGQIVTLAHDHDLARWLLVERVD